MYNELAIHIKKQHLTIFVLYISTI